MAEHISRRTLLVTAAGIIALPIAPGWAADNPVMVYKDPNCGCCTGWVHHLQKNGFAVNTVETGDLESLKRLHNVPADLAACHTGLVAGYVVEGHVPVLALKRLLTEKPSAIGLAVPGMPVGSPGMEGGTPEPFEVVLFGKGHRRSYMRFVADRVLG